MNTKHLSVFVLLLASLLAGCSSPYGSLLPWKETGGPHGRNISAMTVVSLDPGVVYAGLRDGAVYRSVDEGASWSLLSVPSPGAAVLGFALDPGDTSRLFACTERGAFLSEDRGETWSPLPLGAEPLPACRTLAIDPYNSRTIYAGLRGRGIMRSADGGRTWQGANGGDPMIAAGDPYAIVVDPSRPDNIVAAVAGIGIIRSTDGGKRWRRLTPEFSPTSSIPTSVALHPARPGVIVYATDAGRIARSTDNGESWEVARNGLEGDRVTQLIGSSASPERLYAGSATGILFSADFGRTWSPLTTSLPAVPMEVALSPAVQSPLLVLFSDAIGVWRSRNGGQAWTPTDAGPGGSTVSALACDASGSRVFGVIGGTVTAYHPASDDWSPAGPGLRGTVVSSLAVDPADDATLYATTPLGLFVSSDDGTTWQDLTRALAMSPEFVDVHPAIPSRIFASGERGLFLSTDRGISWRECTPPRNGYRVTALTFRPTDAGRVLGATRQSGSLASSDGGLEWRASRQGLASTPLAAITVDREDPNLCYAWAVTGESSRSLNGGIGWRTITPPWNPGDSIIVAFDKARPWSVAVLTASGKLFYSNDGGGTWAPVGVAPLPAPAVSLAWNASTRTLYLGTRHKGVFLLPLDSVVRDLHGE